MGSVFLAVFLPILILCLGGCQGDHTTNSTYDVKPPSYIHICYKLEPDFNECFNKTMNGIVKKVAEGIPEMGVPPTDPISLEEVDTFDAVGVRFKLTNILMRGARNITFTDVKGSFETGKFELEGTLERALFTGDYEISSPIEFLPFIMRGKAKATGNDIKIVATYEIDVALKSDVKFLSMKSFDIRVDVGNSFGSLWLGEQRMDLLSSIISTPFNSRFITRLIMSSMEPTLNSMALKYMNKLFGSVPVDVLIPDHRPMLNTTLLNPVSSNNSPTNVPA